MTKDYVGIDVSKANLDMAIHGSKEYRSFSNDAEGISRAVATLRQVNPQTVVVEATGGVFGGRRDFRSGS